MKINSKKFACGKEEEVNLRKLLTDVAPADFEIKSGRF